VDAKTPADVLEGGFADAERAGSVHERLVAERLEELEGDDDGAFSLRLASWRRVGFMARLDDDLLGERHFRVVENVGTGCVTVGR